MPFYGIGSGLDGAYYLLIGHCQTSLIGIWKTILQIRLQGRTSLWNCWPSIQLHPDSPSLLPIPRPKPLRAQCKYNSHFNNSKSYTSCWYLRPKNNASSLLRHLDTLRNNRFDLEDSLQQVLNDFVLSLLASLLDLLYLDLGILARILLSFLISAGVLYPKTLALVPQAVFAIASASGSRGVKVPSTAYLSLELLELVFLSFPIFINLFLGLVSCLLYTLCAVYFSQLRPSRCCLFQAPHIL